MNTYGIKYYSGAIGDISGNTFTVNLKKKNYSGSTQQITTNQGSLSPLAINWRGGRDQVDTTIKGSELNFTFYALSTDNYDDLLESEYQDFQAEVLENTTSIVSGSTQLYTNTAYGGNAWSYSGTTAYNVTTNSALLTIDYIGGIWSAFLDQVLATGLTITNGLVYGYAGTGCGGAPTDSDFIGGSISIPAGSLSGNFFGTAIDHGVAHSIKLVNQITVNNISCVNGSNIVLSGQPVKIQINKITCNLY